MNTFFTPLPKICLAFIIILVVSACENDIREVQALGRKRIGVEEGTKIVAYISQNGKIKAKLTAPVMYRYLQDSERVEFPKSLHVDFYDSALKVQSQLFSTYGRYFENERKVYLRDSVIVFNVRKDTLWCKELYWDQLKQQFFTDKPAILSQSDPRQRIFADSGLTADQNFKWFTFHKVGPGKHGQKSFINIPDSSAK